ncbi:hypothetical protein PQR46_32120 [Paraburkholderia sediminicola]|uniref:hypothetical protein n=1 Tax=Paraburkholderia sediminicola TaxID=458836 RepID=UPI0038BC4458
MAEALLRTFNLVDSDGKVYIAHEYQTVNDTSNLSGRSSIGGLKSYRLADGTHLNVDGEGFKNLDTGAKLTRK